MDKYAQLAAQIAEYLENPSANHCHQVIAGMGIRSLPVLVEFLHKDLPIERTECLEKLVKLVLRDALNATISGEDARSIARFQKELGFVLKYKSYAIKASVPVGYSIFLQKEGEGFSFQRHVEHTLEVFHIAYAEAALLEIEPPSGNRLVKGFGAREIETIEPTGVAGGEQFLLCDSFVRAARYVIKAGTETTPERDDHRAVLLRISRGRGSVVIADASELGDSKTRLAFNKGDLFLIPPGIHYSTRNEGSGYVEYSEHRIAPGVAFI
jgi:mannose-6-phosphate isomerase-like protein (cupin superfamily)